MLVLAALLRFVDLPTRGTWDADQGHDMLVLRAFVIDGLIPLLGPPTSIGDFHHGVLYYLLLAPAAFVSGADPIAVERLDRPRRHRRGGDHRLAGPIDRRSAGRPPGGAPHGDVRGSRRRIDLHLESECHRPDQLGRPRGGLARLADTSGGVVARRGRRSGRDDARPCSGRGPVAGDRGAPASRTSADAARAANPAGRSPWPPSAGCCWLG